MEKYKGPPTWVLVVLFLAYLPSSLTGCKKSSSSRSPADGKFSFTYNGTRYELPRKEGTAEWGIERERSGIFINRPDIFNGTIRFLYSNCAFLDPYLYGLSIQSDANCKLRALGRPIDSAAVYLYQSGLVNVLYKNCSRKSEYDVTTGRTINYEVCDAEGTFNLVLKNNENKTITITDGTFEMYSFVR